MEDRLRKFKAIVDHGGFNKAAEAVRISQPALSMSIKQLEQELGMTLLDRNKGHVSLTDAGQLVYSAAVTSQLHVQRLKQQLEALKSKKPLLKIGMIDSVAELLFVHHTMLNDISHDVDISLTVDGSRRLSEAVATGSLDIACIVEPQKPPPQTINSRTIGGETLIAVCAPEFERPTSGTPIRFIAYNEHSSSRPIIDNALQSQGIKTKVIMRSTSPEIMLKLCLQGAGFTVLPEHTAQKYLSSGELVALPTPQTVTITRPLLAITHHTSAKSPAVNTVIDAIQSYFS